MAGKHFCVSFANPGDADWCLVHGQSVLWDCGAFTLHTKGTPYDADKYYRWLNGKLGHPNWAIIPDVIGGGEEENDALLADWQFDKWFGAPVWHMHESIQRLCRLVDEWPRIAFGSSAQYWQVGSELWERRADEAWNAIVKRGKPWVHMLRGLALCGDRWPFASADSVNVARNFSSIPICPERMARRIDAVQNPIEWVVRPQTEDLFA